MKPNDLYPVFMDPKLTGFEVNYSDYSDPRKNVKITVLKDSHSTTIELYNPQKLIFIEEEFHQYYIGDLKCLKLQNGLIYLSLDPYDGRINQVSEEDNFVIVFDSYSIIKKD